MSDTLPTPEFEQRLRAAVSSMAPEPDPAALSQLRARLLSQAEQIHQRPRRISARLAWGVGLALIALLIILLVASPTVATALRHLLGYIPGIGLVEQGSAVRALPGPASAERAGIRVTVEQGVSDAGRTVLLLNVEGFPLPASPPQPNTQPACSEQTQLRLPDGTLLVITSGSGHGWETGYTQRLVFPPLPAGKNEAVLEIPCLMAIVPGNWPQNWQIPLTFQPLDASQLTPVIELPAAPTPALAQTVQAAGLPTASPVAALAAAPPAPSAGTTGTSSPAGAAPASHTADYGISFALEKVVELPDGFILMGDLRWTGARVMDYGVRQNHVRLTDAGGREIPLEEVAPDMPAQPGGQHMPWAYKVSGTRFSSPLILALESVVVNLKENVTFQFDPGPDPRPEQTWVLNLAVPGQPYPIHVDSAKMVASPPDAIGFIFTMHSDKDVVGVGMMDLAHPNASSGGGGGEAERGPFIGQVYYSGALPHGVLTLTITDVSVLVSGPWQATWTPPGK